MEKMKKRLYEDGQSKKNDEQQKQMETVKRYGKQHVGKRCEIKR